ncbi:uncharacterized protein LOC34618640 [Cyclospora cayetanensis]|uniref:Uncharacterized protein LOC34618640 n=1 Tax=Cyclospora cayetanensis TaxID=88456 RepID=A0A6P6S0K8_9EIME|nr:uncharacterized protein LOC34618640 [Cyclospora cayetanensis]
MSTADVWHAVAAATNALQCSPHIAWFSQGPGNCLPTRADWARSDTLTDGLLKSAFLEFYSILYASEGVSGLSAAAGAASLSGTSSIASIAVSGRMNEDFSGGFSLDSSTPNSLAKGSPSYEGHHHEQQREPEAQLQNQQQVLGLPCKASTEKDEENGGRFSGRPHGHPSNAAPASSSDTSAGAIPPLQLNAPSGGISMSIFFRAEAEGDLDLESVLTNSMAQGIPESGLGAASSKPEMAAAAAATRTELPSHGDCAENATAEAEPLESAEEKAQKALCPFPETAAPGAEISSCCADFAENGVSTPAATREAAAAAPEAKGDADWREVERLDASSDSSLVLNSVAAPIGGPSEALGDSGGGPAARVAGSPMDPTSNGASSSSNGGISSSSSNSGVSGRNAVLLTEDDSLTEVKEVIDLSGAEAQDSDDGVRSVPVVDLEAEAICLDSNPHTGSGVFPGELAQGEAPAEASAAGAAADAAVVLDSDDDDVVELRCRQGAPFSVFQQHTYMLRPSMMLAPAGIRGLVVHTQQRQRLLEEALGGRDDEDDASSNPALPRCPICLKRYRQQQQEEDAASRLESNADTQDSQQEQRAGGAVGASPQTNGGTDSWNRDRDRGDSLPPVPLPTAPPPPPPHPAASERDHVVALKCGHVFCKGCILVALRTRRQCPVCRVAVKGSRPYQRIFL